MAAAEGLRREDVTGAVYEIVRLLTFLQVRPMERQHMTTLDDAVWLHQEPQVAETWALTWSGHT